MVEETVHFYRNQATSCMPGAGRVPAIIFKNLPERLIELTRDQTIAVNLAQRIRINGNASTLLGTLLLVTVLLK